ncbi:hypothetical protein B0J18DRAFT_88951 [Chaetomium sp. MPI-SDFR-AT-0129]|nr:hypothetical protein B0J18DRAFT_88951 [Chaetomium sp. MPI-SDFR-AT-0129]
MSTLPEAVSPNPTAVQGGFTFPRSRRTKTAQIGTQPTHPAPHNPSTDMAPVGVRSPSPAPRHSPVTLLGGCTPPGFSRRSSPRAALTGLESATTTPILPNTQWPFYNGSPDPELEKQKMIGASRIELFSGELGAGVEENGASIPAPAVECPAMSEPSNSSSTRSDYALGEAGKPESTIDEASAETDTSGDNQPRSVSKASVPSKIVPALPDLCKLFPPDGIPPRPKGGSVTSQSGRATAVTSPRLLKWLDEQAQV